MKYQKKQEAKKKIISAVALIMAIIMVLSLLAPFTILAAPVTQEVTTVAANKEEETKTDASVDSLKSFGQEQFSVEVQAGFQESYIVKKAMPVRGVITNHGEAFHGEVQIKAYTRASSSDKEYAIYYQKLDLEQGASKSIDMDVTMGNIHKYIGVSLVDTKGNIVFQDYIYLTPKDPKTIMTGVLSESPQDLKYINNLYLAQLEDDSMEYGTEVSRKYDFSVFMDESTFPNSINVLNSFSALIVDDFDFSVLSQEQVDALHQWILGGGTLVVGTGASAQKTLKGLDFISDIHVDGTTVASGVQGVAGVVSLAQLSGERLTQVKHENGNSIFSQIQIGQGHVLFSHFSLSETPMAGRNETLDMLQEILLQVAQPSFIVASHDDGRDYDRLSYIARDFPPFEMSSVYLIIGAIIVYILVAGPVMYLVLKKKDKREKGWIIIPILSFVFMGLVFFLAQSSTYKNGLINTVAYVEMQEGSNVAKADVGVALKSSGKGDITFTGEEKMPISVAIDDYYNYDGMENEKCVYRILSGDTTEIVFVDGSSWGTQYFRTQRSVDLGGSIESTVAMKGEKFIGEIINHTNMDFYKVVLMLGGNLHEFDALGAGETLKVEVGKDDLAQGNTNYYRGYYYDDIREKVRTGEITRQEAYLNYIEEDLRQQFYNYEESIELIPVTFFGYSDASILSGEMEVNGKSVLENNMVMYQQSFPLELSKQEEFWIGLEGSVDGPVKFDQYDHGFGDKVYPFEDSEFYIGYNLPKGVRIDSLELHVEGEEDGTFMPEDMKIYNRKTQQWDDLAMEESIQAQDYLDENHLVEVSVHCMKERETKVPKLYIQGGGLFAGN